VFEDDGIRLFDLSTPFLHDDDGSDPLNWDALLESHLSGLLRPLRPYYFRQLPVIY
jgi:hypothetical protein